MNAKDKLQLASERIAIARDLFAAAEEKAIETLKTILEPAGEDGVSLCPEDCTCGYCPLAEQYPQKIKPITHVRYFDGKLEVFVAEYKPCEDGEGWEFLPGGEWVGYADAMTDTWYLLDEVDVNLEYANGYQDE